MIQGIISTSSQAFQSRHVFHRRREFVTRAAPIVLPSMPIFYLWSNERHREIV